MAEQPLVSVVIPTRNRREMLEETVASVFEQSIGDWELIVVDDASEDDTWSWLRQIDDPRVRSIRSPERREQNGSRNVGLRDSRGQFSLSLDDDDLLMPHALETHLQAFQQFPDAIVSVGGFRAFDEEGGTRTVKISKRRVLRKQWNDFLFGWTATTSQSLFRTDLLKSVDGWNESWIRATDHELWSRLTRLGRFVLNPQIVLKYRVHAGQWRPSNLEEIMRKARRSAMEQTQGKERARNERIFRARDLAVAADTHFFEGHAGKALAGYLKAMWVYPELLASPYARPRVMRPFMKCCLGSFGLRSARAVLNRLRRDVDFKVRATENQDVMK